MKRSILTLILFAACGPLADLSVQAAPSPADPVAENIFDPAHILEHGEDIGLTDAQRDFIMTEMHGAEDRFSGLHQTLQKEMEATAALLKHNHVDETAALAQFEKMLDRERVIKRAHLALMVSLKNKLTPEQQAKLQEIKKQQALITAQTGHAPEPHAAVIEKQKRVAAAVQKWIDDGRDPSAVGELMQDFDRLAQAGKFRAAEELLDRALKLLGVEDKPKKSEVDSKKSTAGIPIFPDKALTAATLRAEIDSWRPAKLAWREIPWRPCLLAGLAEAREHKKPVILWAFINGSPTDERC